MLYNIDSLTSSSGKRDRSDNQINNQELSDQNSRIIDSGKRMKSAGTVAASNSLSAISNNRIFGEELCTNNTTIDEFFRRTSVRDGSITSKTETDNCTVASDCGTTEGSVVAQLRGKLQDFEQKNQHHYLKNVVVPSKDELEKPLRPKVKPTTKDKPGPTPLPKHAADALMRRMVDQNASSVSTPSIFRQRSTPVRLRIKATPAEDVQATNEGYASVAKLSKWLADDPTSTKKVKQLRRGANIIAKSRKFDKVLANAEIEHVIPRNCVTRSKILLQQALSNDDNDEKIFAVTSDGNDETTQPIKSTTPDWMKLGTTASLSVSDKKKWLSSAFQNSSLNVESDGNIVGQHSRSTPVKIGKARTEILSSSSRRDDLGTLAKEKWRQRTPTKVPVPVVPRPQEVVAQPMNEISLQMNNQGDARPDGCLASSQLNVAKQVVLDNNNSGSTIVDFHSARDMLVQRSKANGNDVDVMTAFQRRKARFQQLERESQRRQSTANASMHSSLYKATWDNASGGATNGYVKAYKEDIAPKKSFNDLP